MKITIEIEMNNAAFCDNGPEGNALSNACRRGGEVARILQNLASDFVADGIEATDCYTLNDANGGRCGFARVSR